jgi:hypothetical protein
VRQHKYGVRGFLVRVSEYGSWVMGKSIARSLGAIAGFGFWLVACSGSKETTGGAGGVGGSSIGTIAGMGGLGNSGAGGSDASRCLAGTKRCDGTVVKVCDLAGSKESVAQTCLPSQSCSAGACVEGACAPNTEFCKDNAVWKCDANGASVSEEQCAAALFCREEADRASCNSQACVANEPVCDGNVASHCKSDSSGPAAGGVDCSNSKQACYAGQCREIVCKSGTKLCEHGDVYLCAHNGTDISLVTECNSGEVCDADAGSCRSKICDPGKVSCDGTRVQTCNAFGSAWLPGAQDCAADGKICVSGSCKKQVCAANRSYCQDGSVYSCDSSGTVTTLSQTCNAQTEHCMSYGSFASCKLNDCQGGDKLCADNMIKVCNADGSLPSSGTACSSTQFCENAECKERPCVLGSYLCKTGNVYYCDFEGPYLAQQCDPDTACKALGTSQAFCAPLACSPASSACLGNQIGTCASDGKSLSQVTNDCTATASVCTTDLKCAKSVTDTVGVGESAETFPTSYVVGDVIDVDSARKLTELATQLVFVGQRDLRWVVYELSAQNFVPKFDKIVSVANGNAGFIGSGPLSFQLAAGKRYLLAVVITGGDAIDYVDSLPFAGKLSFGAAVGRVVTSYPGTFDVFSVDPNYLSQMKVTTEAP